jgi:hypothetical protein
MCCFQNLLEWILGKKNQKTVFNTTPQTGFSVLKKYEKPIYAQIMIKNLISVLFVYQISIKYLILD